MKYELKNDIETRDKNANDIPVGTIFIAYGKSNINEKFLALKVEDIDEYKYILDIEDDKLYTDVKNYYVYRIINGKFVEE